jgi:hypothetical protein
MNPAPAARPCPAASRSPAAACAAPAQTSSPAALPAASGIRPAGRRCALELGRAGAASAAPAGAARPGAAASRVGVGAQLVQPQHDGLEVTRQVLQLRDPGGVHMNRLGTRRCSWAAMSSATSLGGRASLSLRCAAAYSSSTVPASRATSCAIRFRRVRPSAMRALKLAASVGSGSARKARSSATSMICSRSSSACPGSCRPRPSSAGPGCSFPGTSAARGSAAPPAGAGRRGAWRRHSGSSKTSISTCVSRSISAGKPISAWPALRISISSGSSPKVQSV